MNEQQGIVTYEAYRVTWTEYEHDELGCSQRPDGVTYALKLADLHEEIRRQEALGDEDCYSRAGGYKKCLINEELYQLLTQSPIVNTIRNDHAGFIGLKGA